MNRWPRWSLEGEPVALAKYVNPDAVAALVRLPGASSAGRTDRLREVYRALAAVGIGYAFESPSDERGRQVILTPARCSGPHATAPASTWPSSWPPPA